MIGLTLCLLRCFYINVPIGALSILAIVLFFKAPAAAKPQEASWKEKFLQMDPVGAILMMGAVISLILALQKGGQTDPWDAPEVLGLLIAAGVTIILFGLWEFFQGERAMIVPRLFKRRLVFFPAMFLMFFAGGYYTLIYNLPLYFQSIDGTSPTESGEYCLVAACHEISGGSGPNCVPLHMLTNMYRRSQSSPHHSRLNLFYPLWELCFRNRLCGSSYATGRCH